MTNKQSLLKIQSEYKEEIQMCKDFILTRLENSSMDDESRIKNLENPFSLECILIDIDNQIDHSYDVARKESFERCLSDIEYLLAYEI
jgi:hypothetical protein